MSHSGSPSRPDLPADLPTGLWIDGAPREAASGARFDVDDPATGQTLTTVADAGAQDALDALGSAAAAAEGWAATPPRERGEILRRAWELVTGRADDFTTLMTLEMGKALPDSAAETSYGAEYLRWFAEEAVRVGGRTAQAPAGNGSILVTKEPVGPALAITPWNFPLAMGTRKIGAALAAGCPMIVKPAQETPLTMLALAAVFAEAGLPAGVLSVVTATSASTISTALMNDPRLRKVTFTGSTGVGRVILEQSAPQLLRSSLELGGNAPFIVFDDADLDAALQGAMAAKMRNGGQACTAANRFLVAESVGDEFIRRLSDSMAGLTMGPGYAAGTEVGPMVSVKQRDRVADLVDEAVAAGARLHTGGERPDGPGAFYPPTLLSQVPDDCAITTEEIFGPVAVVGTFRTEQEAIERANRTDYGLAAYFYSRDLDRTLRVSRALRSGMVGVNRGVISDPAAPFGGVKASGIGREGGSEGIEEYLDTKYIALT